MGLSTLASPAATVLAIPLSLIKSLMKMQQFAILRIIPRKACCVSFVVPKRVSRPKPSNGKYCGRARRLLQSNKHLWLFFFGAGGSKAATIACPSGLVTLTKRARVDRPYWAKSLGASLPRRRHPSICTASRHCTPRT